MNTPIADDFPAIAAKVAAITSGAHTAPLAAAAAGDDAELLRLCGEFHRLHAAAHAPFVEDDEPLMVTALHRRWGTSDQIALIPAMTDAGRRAKAAVASVLLDEWGILETGSTIIFARAALRDIAGAVEPPLALETKPNTDAELIRLHAAMVAQGAAMACMKAEAEDAGILFGNGITPESEAHEEKMADADNAWLDMAKKIADIPAKTSAGLHVKALATLLVLESCVRDSIDDTLDDIADGSAGELEDRLSLSIARDILAGSAQA